MRLYGVRIFVDDLEAARGFYRDTLGLPAAWDRPEMGAFGVALENAELIIEREDPTGPDGALVGRFLGLSLQVVDIDAAHTRLAASGVPFDLIPTLQPWGGTLAHFRDPAGNVLTLLGG